MKKQDIVTLAQLGFLNASAHCLPANEFYKWYKFRRQVTTALKEIAADEETLRTQCGIAPGQKEVSKDVKERFVEVRKKLLDENIAIDTPSRIPFKYYKEIYDENNIGENDIFTSAALEGLVIDALFETE